MSEPSNTPAGSPEERPHLKFNPDVLPEFQRRTDTAELPILRGDRRTVEETDSLIKWIGVVIVALGIAAIIGVISQRRGRATVAAEATAIPDVPAIIEQVERDRDRAKAVVRAYLGAPTVAARSEYVRRPEQVAPLMQQYYAERRPAPLEVLEFGPVDPQPLEGRAFWIAVAKTPAKPERGEILLLEKVDSGFKVDWETHVGYNPMSPERYVKQRPAGKLDFRVYVSRDDYYNGDFDDSRKYLAAKLEFADSPVNLVGYIDKRSRDFSRFLNLVDLKKQVPLILTLEWPAGDPGGDPPQVRIQGLAAESWLLLD
jgi:hypothetical protein